MNHRPTFSLFHSHSFYTLFASKADSSILHFCNCQSKRQTSSNSSRNRVRPAPTSPLLPNSQKSRDTELGFLFRRAVASRRFHLLVFFFLFKLDSIVACTDEQEASFTPPVCSTKQSRTYVSARRSSNVCTYACWLLNFRAR